ncbi:MAG: ATP-dependent helicase [Ignavibacteriales bacterium]|nr:MAG: ATP-dependent helicase [Ignavibacteriales bacterium]
MKAIDFKKELNSEQYEVVTAGNGPHLVLAGAGSGKTRTLTYRAAWLISQGIKPEKILLLTFTNKAAYEMISRVKKLLGLKVEAKFPLWGGTFHSVANRLLRIYGKYVDIAPDFTIIDTDDSNNLLKLISQDYFGSLAKKHQPSPGVLRETISFATNSKISISDSLETKFSEWMPLLENIEKIASEYQRRKRQSNVLDFDDLLIFWKSLTEHPEASQILQKKWEYVLVDEYQDTNVIQAEIIFNLSKGHNNILAVGDDAQSIYSFRAANIRNILEFPEKFKDTKLHKLETNYRSTPEILDVANQIIAANTKQFVKNLKAVKESHVRPELAALMSPTQEANYIADKIEEHLDRGLRPDQIAVLFRAASYSQNLEMELNRRGINYEIRGGLRFFERAHIKDLLSYIKVLGNVKDEVAWLRILQMEEGIGPVTAHRIYQEIIKVGDLSKLRDVDFDLADKAGVAWKGLLTLFEDLLTHKDTNISKLINIVINFYQPYLKEKFTDYRQREDDLEQLAIFASSYDSLELFLNEIGLQESFSGRESENREDNIVLSTVHQAKGLEWELVFVINMTDKSFPHPFCVREEEIEEERRLFYVATTRASRYLCLSYPLSMFRYDGFQSLKPSPFLSDIDSDLLNHNEMSRSATYASEDGIEYTPDPDGFLPDVSDW